MTDALTRDAYPRPAYPQSPPRNYAKALASLYRLTKDKENTEHVFGVIRYAGGDSPRAAYERFLASETGGKVLADPDRLIRVLSDRDRLRALPEGTFGRVYAEFMDREGLDANGVQEAAQACEPERHARLKADYPEAFVYFTYQNQNHDLYHVVSGYGRDALGEAALLRFTYHHTGSDGVAFLSRFAGLRVRMEAPRVPVGPIMREAARIGSAAVNFSTTDWAPLMGLPLDEVRRRLNVTLPERYLAVPKATLHAIGERFTKPGEEKPEPAPLTA